MKNPGGKVVIIGGGLGGLATALRLSSGGWPVTVLERGDRMGGKMNRWEQQGFVFDTGPSLITMPHVFRELFSFAGETLDNHLSLVQIDPITEYCFADGVRFPCTASLPGWLSTLSQIAPEDIDGFYRFMTLGSRLFELSQATFFRRHPGEAPDTGVLAGLRHFPLRYAWGRYDRTVRRLFRSPYLRQLYNRYPTYVGSSPYRAPATLAIIPYMELVFGGWYIIGGLYRLVETLERLLLDRDVVLLTDAPVCRIHREGDRVNGVELEDGRRLPADIVVMNGDASCAGVLFNDPSRRPMSLADRSMSGLVFLFGVKKTMPSRPHHTVFFSGDYEREFHQLCEEYRFPDDPTVYVNIASRTDRSVTPGEGETLFIMANAPATDEPWPEERIENARKAVMRRLRAGGLDFEDDIVVSDVWTPERMAMRYAMPGGAIYGTNSHGWKNAFLRTPNRDRRVRGLYYVGGSAHPGGGTPTVLMSARITADRIRQDAG